MTPLLLDIQGSDDGNMVLPVLILLSSRDKNNVNGSTSQDDSPVAVSDQQQLLSLRQQPALLDDPSIDAVIVPAAAAAADPRLSRRVRFGAVKTRYYHQILGDHPLCHDGLPITFGWTWYEDNEGCEEDKGDSDDAHVQRLLARGEQVQASPSPSVDDREPVTTNTTDTTITTLGSSAPNCRHVPVRKLSLVTRMALLLESGISEEEIAQRIRTSQRRRSQVRRQQYRAKMWLQFLERTKRALQSSWKAWSFTCSTSDGTRPYCRVIPPASSMWSSSTSRT